MFDKFRDMASLMKNAAAMRERAEQLKAELEKRTVEGESGGGAVRVTMNGKGRVVRVELDRPLLTGIAGDDKTVVEELIASAVNAAADKVQELLAEEVRKLTGGMDLPDMSGLLGQ